MAVDVLRGSGLRYLRTSLWSSGGLQMSATASMVEGLKRALKAKRLGYRDVAMKLDLSEASVKRLFSKGGFTLERFEEVCGLAGISMTELAKESDRTLDAVSQLSMEQELAIMKDVRLLLVAVCALNHLRIDEIVAFYDLSKADCIRLLLQLEKIRFLELLPDNRIRLKVTHTFEWIANGPIQQYFKAKAQNEFFRTQFGGANEAMLLVNGMVTPGAASLVLSKLRRLANEFAEIHEDQKRLPVGERRSLTLLLAMRPWELDDFHELRRDREKKVAPAKRTSPPDLGTELSRGA